MEGVNAAFEKAINCAGTEPYCKRNKISSYTFSQDSIFLELETDCFPTAARSSNPEYKKAVERSSMSSYLSDFGKRALMIDKYADMSYIDKYIYQLDNEEHINTYSE